MFGVALQDLSMTCIYIQYSVRKGMFAALIEGLQLG
jgi:hypothetical protein